MSNATILPSAIPDFTDPQISTSEWKFYVLMGKWLTGQLTPPVAGEGSGGAGVVQTPSWTAATSSGTIAAGATRITVSTSADWVGTVGGASFPASSAMTWVAAGSNTLAALAYVRTAGTINIGLVV